MTNQVTVFTNGIADFHKSQELVPDASGKQEVIIPVKKDHIGDVLASLDIRGNVKCTPPTFTPSNEEHGKLQLDTQNIQFDIAKKLVGSDVSIDCYSGGATISGKLMGISSEDIATGGEAIKDHSYNVWTLTGIQRASFKNVKNLKFGDDRVKSEIEKVLQRSYDNIRPQASHIRLQVAPLDGVEKPNFVINYTVPVAAWKTSYRLHLDKGKVDFAAFAVVDNNTEDDWLDTYISVVTGSPITFGTDLAISKIPRRQMINIVDQEANAPVVPKSARMLRMQSVNFGPNVRQDECYSAAVDLSEDEGGLESFGAVPGGFKVDTDIDDVGDFSIFRSKSVLNVRAGESTTFPIYESELDKSKPVLYYNFNNNQERPYRTILFTNESNHNLGRGVCTIREKNVYSGSCVLPATRPGDTKMLPYALETGIKVFREHKPEEPHWAAVNIASGTAIVRVERRCVTQYEIENSKDESFELVIDHMFNLGPETIVEVNGPIEIKQDKIDGGRRYTIDLPPKSAITIVTYERCLQRVEYHFNINFIHQLIAAKHDLLDNDDIKKIIRLQEEFTAIEQELAQFDTELAQQKDAADRYSRNLSSGSSRDKWESSLAAAEDRITELQTTIIPQRLKTLQEKKSEQHEVFKNLSSKWKW